MNILYIFLNPLTSRTRGNDWPTWPLLWLYGWFMGCNWL